MRKSLCMALAILLAGSAAAQTFTESSFRDITPEGWLRERLEIQKEGLTGHPEALSYPYNTCLWAGKIPRMGRHGNDWWRYEQTAYYTDGLLRLGYALRDSALMAKGEAGIAYTLAHAQPSGRLGNRKLESLWPVAVFFRAMQAAYDMHPDPALLEALREHYLSIPADLLTYWRNIVNLEGMLWTAARTGDTALVERADSAYRYRELTGVTPPHRYFDVNPVFLDDPKPYDMHGVTMCEMLKLPILLWTATGDPSYRDLAVRSLERLLDEDLLPDGVISSAEYLKGRDILHSHETCDIVDLTWTLGYFLAATGEARYADLIERAVFNAGFGAVTPDFKALQYFSSVNQFIATGTSNHNAFKFGSTWMAYRPTHSTECCAGNIHRLLPNYTARLWMRTPEGPVATLYGPSTFQEDDHCTWVEETAYPYDETVTFRVQADRRVKRTLRLRIPQWCEEAVVKVNGKVLKDRPAPGSFFALTRRFRDGDRIELVLPMPVRRQEAFGGGVFFERGPLLYSYAIPAKWERDDTVYPNMNGKFPENPDFPCWSITPDGPWNYAVAPDAMPEVCAGGDGPALRLQVIPIDWTLRTATVPAKKKQAAYEALMTPDLPGTVTPVGAAQEIRLVPYGSTQLRLTVFPVCDL